MTSFIPSADSGSCRETRTILSRPSRNSLASTVWIRLSFPTRVQDFERFACLYRTPCTTRCTHRAVWYLVSFDRFGRSHRTLKPCTLDTGRGTSGFLSPSAFTDLGSSLLDILFSTFSTHLLPCPIVSPSFVLGRFVSWLIGWQVVWLAVWLFGRLVASLAGCLVFPIVIFFIVSKQISITLNIIPNFNLFLTTSVISIKGNDESL